MKNRVRKAGERSQEKTEKGNKRISIFSAYLPWWGSGCGRIAVYEREVTLVEWKWEERTGAEKRDGKRKTAVYARGDTLSGR
jgi:hypothetical protein